MLSYDPFIRQAVNSRVNSTVPSRFPWDCLLLMSSFHTPGLCWTSMWWRSLCGWELNQSFCPSVQEPLKLKSLLPPCGAETAMCEEGENGTNGIDSGHRPAQLSFCNQCRLPQGWWARPRVLSTTFSGKVICGPVTFSICFPASNACLKVKAKVPQLCPTLCDPADPTVHGVLQAGILEWVAYPFSSACFWPRNRTSLLHCRRILYQLSYCWFGEV